MNEAKNGEAATVSVKKEQTDIEKKYAFLKEKIMLHYRKGCKILKIAKITVAVLFLVFTLIAVVLSRGTAHQLQWLAAWIVLIFVNVFVFVPADYAKYLIGSKVIPYLQDENRIEFGEYDIFMDEDEEEDEEE